MVEQFIIAIQMYLRYPAADNVIIIGLIVANLLRKIRRKSSLGELLEHLYLEYFWYWYRVHAGICMDKNNLWISTIMDSL